MFTISTHYSFGEYQYSNLAHWAYGAAGVGGVSAFGIPTPAGGVPTTGSASYRGMIEGTSTVMVSFGDWGMGAAGIGG